MRAHLQAKVATVSQRAPVLAAPDEPLAAVAHRLWMESVGVAVVGSAEEPLGIISERDVVAALAQGADAATVTAAEAMTPHVVSVRADEPLAEASHLMLDREFRHVPVVDEADRVVGMVSVRDLLRPLLLDALGG